MSYSETFVPIGFAKVTGFRENEGMKNETKLKIFNGALVGFLGGLALGFLLALSAVVINRWDPSWRKPVVDAIGMSIMFDVAALVFLGIVIFAVGLNIIINRYNEYGEYRPHRFELGLVAGFAGSAGLMFLFILAMIAIPSERKNKRFDEVTQSSVQSAKPAVDQKPSTEDSKSP